LGARAGLAAAAVSHFETGQRAPSIESLARLADALDVSADVLLGRRSGADGSDVDPLFLRASRASTSTLDTIRKITEALLAAEKSAEKGE
jgi:transcriptional regulator with XRE-family HTH domain